MKIQITEELLRTANVSIDVCNGDVSTIGDRIFGAVIDWQFEADGTMTLLCEYASDNLGVPFRGTPAVTSNSRKDAT